MKRIDLLLYLFSAVLLVSACKKKDERKDSNNESIIIFYTNDEHGWMEPTDEYGGAAGMSGLWKTREGYNGSDPYLVLSGGDMWTGPAISTWFQGEPMTAAMNEMGYDAAAIGNHEFDFTVDVLKVRVQQMSFPILAANLKEKKTGNTPAFVKPYIIKTINDIKVGIIGLASLSTPFSGFPDFVADYEFTNYAEAIDTYAPIVQSEGADIILIIGHICLDEMEALVPTAKKYNIPFIGGAHCHHSILQINDGVILAQTNGELREYIKVELGYDKTNNSINIISKEAVENKGTTVDTKVEDIVSLWQNKADEALSEEIGYCSTTILQSSVEMSNMVCDSWFYAFPDADVSITNARGIRTDIEVGAIQLETIVGLLPFNNSILKLELTGAELLKCIDNYLIGGMTIIGGNFLSDGSPIETNNTYSVLTTDYLYSVDDEFSLYDSTPENTSVHYRQPLIDWIKSLNTSSENPLNKYLDSNSRR